MSNIKAFWTKDTEYIRNISHHKNAGVFTDDMWVEWGDFVRDKILELLQGYVKKRDLKRMSVIDYGCGGGAISRILCKLFNVVYGVDISSISLKEAEKQMKAYSFDNFIPLEVNIDNPIMVMKVDFVVSFAVFQHFPSKEYMEKVVSSISSSLNSGGIFIIQNRYYKNNQKYIQKIDNYDKHHISFTSIDTDEFTYMCKKYNLIFIKNIIEDSPRQYEYYMFKKGE